MRQILKLTSFENWRFLQLTIFLVAFWIVSPLISDRWLVRVLTQFLLLNALLVTLSSIGTKLSLKKVVLAFWSLAMIGSLLALLPVREDLRILGFHLEHLFSFLVLLILVTSILLLVFRSNRVTLDGIFAAVVAYLLIAYAFALLYMLVAAWIPGSFTGVIANMPGLNDMIYFSLVTIATLGYGDILPATTTARMLATLEAVIGQFYVAVIVAVLVGTFISQRFEAKQSQ